MIKNAKKTEAEKQLIKFRNQMHNLLIKYPGIRISCTQDGDVVAWMRTGDAYREYEQVYLPTSGAQELITKQEEIESEQAAEQSVYDDMMAFEERFLASMER